MEETKQLLGHAQMYQQQIQTVLAQKEALKLQLAEIEKALEELEKTGERDVYKLAGPVLIKTKLAEVKKDLHEKKKLINLRLKTLEDSERKIKEKLDELRKKLAKSEEVKVGS